MLKKRTRSMQKDQQTNHTSGLTMVDCGSESDVSGSKPKTSSFFSVSGLFIGLSPKGLSETDSVNSPTSPLDARVFSNLSSGLKSFASSQDGIRKKWDCTKVGLGIIDSLDDDVMKISEKPFCSSESKNILFGPQIRTSKTPDCQIRTDPLLAPKSLPKNYAIFPQNRTIRSSLLQQANSDVLFEIADSLSEPQPFGKVRACSLDSCRSFSGRSGHRSGHRRNDLSLDINSGNNSLENKTTHLTNPIADNYVSIASGNGFIGSLRASEIELSEDYTCVISHGSNPKTTYIYGDCILECHSNDLSNFVKNEEKKVIEVSPEPVESSDISTSYPSSDFLSFCDSCNKKLEEGKDIYIYRGEKAFCSLDCRAQQILIDEELEKSINKSSEDSKSDIGHNHDDHDDEIFETGIIIDP